MTEDKVMDTKVTLFTERNALCEYIAVYTVCSGNSVMKNCENIKSITKLHLVEMTGGCMYSTIIISKFTRLRSALPLVVVEEILLNLPAQQVVRDCRLVCHEWKDLVDSAAHWRERCRRERFQPRDASRVPADWRLFYFLSKKRRNLLKNPRAKEKLKRWNIIRNGGDGWSVHDTARNPFHDITVTQCFVTSFGLCLKQQLIDLKKEGYSPAIMDQWQPTIKISDWYTPRCDCGCHYEIVVRLLGQNKKVIRIFQPEKVFFKQWNDEQWCHMTHVFKDYGPGVRFIDFIHGGKDTQFWKGWYGIRVTDSSVEICPVEET